MTKLTTIYPEALLLIRALRVQGAKLAILSNKISVTIRECLEVNGISEYFDLVLGLGDYGRPKPAPDGLYMAIELLKIQKNDALYLGDHLVDAETAMAAGVDFAAVTTGNTKRADFEALPHIRIVDTLDEIIS